MSRVSVGTTGKYPPPMEPERSCGEADEGGAIGETFSEVDGLKTWGGGPGWEADDGVFWRDGS